MLRLPPTDIVILLSNSEEVEMRMSVYASEGGHYLCLLAHFNGLSASLDMALSKLPSC